MSDTVYPIQNLRPCDQLKTPVYMLSLGVSLLRQYFGQEDRIALDNAKFLWTVDQADSQVYINNADNLDFKVIGKRPAVIVHLAESSFPKDVIADVAGYDLESGMLTVLDRMESGWTFKCISKVPTEAMSLATEIKYFVQTYRRYIADAHQLDTLRTAKISQCQKSPDKDYTDYYECLVSVPFTLNETFLVGKEGLRMTAIALNLVSI